MDPKIIPEIETQEETAQAPLYRVIIHNDDVTPMNFVVEVLMTVFLLSAPGAEMVMYTAHYHGSAYVCSLPKSEAERRVAQAHMMAAMEGYPLRFTIEVERG